MPQELTSVDDISTRLGSYGLLIELSEDFSLSRPRFYGAVLKKGQFLYAGSAFGPTGTVACLGFNGYRRRHTSPFEECLEFVDYIPEGDKLAENWIFIDMLHFLKMQGVDLLADIGG